MQRFEHPLQLFSLEHPEDWESRYQEETGGLILVHPGLHDAVALSVTPIAVTGAESPLVDQLLEVARRVGAEIPAESVLALEDGATRVAYGEGQRAEAVDTGSVLRFWVIRHGHLSLHVAQIGPGVVLPGQREAADAILASLQFPEVLPPSPEIFRRRVLEVLDREYPQVRARPEGEWLIRLTDPHGRPVGTLGLENLYRTCLLNAESAGALIREHLDQALDSGTNAEVGEYAEAAGRLMPALKSEEWVRTVEGGEGVIRVPFAPGLLLCFALDEPAYLAYVTEEMLQRWGVPLERVQEVALDNLARKSDALQMVLLQDQQDRPCALIVNMRDGYDATRLALPGVREAFAEELGDSYLVGVPNRDFLVAFSDREPEIAAGIIRQVRHDHARMDHPITATIYRVSPDRIEPSDL